MCAAVLWSVQVDAAAKDEEDDVLHGGGRARVTGESCEEEGQGRMRRGSLTLFIRRRLISGHEN